MSCLKQLGFLNIKKNYDSQLINSGFSLQKLDSETKIFLKNSYYNEYVNLILKITVLEFLHSLKILNTNLLLFQKKIK